MEIKIYLSYADHQLDDIYEITTTTVVQQIFEIFYEDLYKIIEYKTAQPYKANIPEFINEIAGSQNVIILVSKKYLYSEYCMLEVIKLMKDKKILWDRTYPLVFDDVDITSVGLQTDVIRHWEKVVEIYKTEEDTIKDSIRKVEIINRRAIVTEIASQVQYFMKEISDRVYYSIPKNRSKEDVQKTLNKLKDEITRRNKSYVPSDILDSNDNKLFGRKDIINSILKYLLLGRSLPLEGGKWIGKTAIFEEITRYYVEYCDLNDLDHEKLIIKYIDMRLLERAKDFYDNLNTLGYEILSEKFNFNSIDKDHSIIEILERRNKKLFLLLDNYDSALDKPGFNKSFYNNLKSICSQSRVSIVYTVSTYKEHDNNALEKKAYFATTNRVEIDFFSPEIAFDYISKIVPSGCINYEKVFSMVKYLGGVHPYFLSLIRDIAQKYQHKENDFAEQLKTEFHNLVLEKYLILIKILTKGELKQLHEFVKHNPKDPPFSLKFRSFLYKYEGYFRPFSKHFEDFLINYQKTHGN